MSVVSIAEKFRRRISGALRRLIQAPRIAIYNVLSDAKIQGKPILYQPLQAIGLGEIEFSGEVRIGVYPSPFFFNTYAYLEARKATSKITIMDGTWINNHFTAIAEHTSITIGERVLIGTGVEIFDSDFHGLNINERGRSDPQLAKPVVIENDVFLGSNSKILKGVTIGRGSIIANSSVVTRNIPSGVIAGGNPARVIRPLG